MKPPALLCVIVIGKGEGNILQTIIKNICFSLCKCSCSIINLIFKLFFVVCVKNYLDFPPVVRLSRFSLNIHGATCFCLSAWPLCLVSMQSKYTKKESYSSSVL